MESRYYVVKQGDSLWGIAKHFGYGVDQLAARNNLTGKQKNLISVGQRIYLPDGESGPDLRLDVRLIGLSSKPVKHVKLEIAHDGMITETKTDEEGWLHGLDIQDHAKGLKIEFENYEGKWQTIFDEEALPLGEKILQINIMTDLIKGRTARKEGTTIVPDARVGVEVKKQTPQPAVNTTPRKSLPDVPAAPIVTDMRTSNGQPTTVNAPLFASENLYLKKGNEKFRQAIIDAAKRYNLTPHAFAAIINAEAAKAKDGSWVETSAGSGEARGLGQFLPPAWFQYVAKPGTVGNAEALKLTGANKLLAANETLYKVNGKDKTEVSASMQKAILSWRDNGGYAIDAIGAYAEDNLNELKQKGIDATGLPPDEKVKIAYIMHHEGPEGGVLYLTGTLGKTKKSDEASVVRRLAKQFKTKDKDGSVKAKALADRFGGDYVKAYYYFLANHTETMVRAKNFMLKHEGFNERSAYEVLQAVSGFSIDRPNTELTPSINSAPKLTSVSPDDEKEVGPMQGVGGVPAWSDPLDSCTIRVGGYSNSESNPANARAKSLFGGREGKHKGIDLDATSGTPVKAVANGKVIYAGPGGSYGNIILMRININDLPSTQKHYAEKIPDIKQHTIYFMYAHLSEIQVSNAKAVQAGQVIGKCGNSGNAKGMTLVGPYSKGKDKATQYGAHLHFEVRLNASLKKGEGKWADPKPFLNKCN